MKSETQFSPDPYSTFYFLFALELEGGTATSIVFAVPTSSSSTDLLRYYHPDTSSEF